MEPTSAAYRRHEEIKKCLMEMLKTTPYKQISVSDLCAKMGIARKNFYKHYRDKRDCLCNLVDDALAETQAYTASNITEWELSLSSAIVVMECWKKKADLLDVIAKNHLYEFLMERAILFAQGEDVTTVKLLDRPEMPCDEDILSSYLSCHFTIVFNWYARGFDTSVEEMAKKYLRLSHRPMIALSDNAAMEQV